MATNFMAKFGYLRSFGTAAFQNKLQYCDSNRKIFNDNIFSTSSTNVMNIGQVTPEMM